MSSLTVISIHALLNKAVRNLSPASLGKLKDHNRADSKNNLTKFDNSGDKSVEETRIKRLSVAKKVVSYQPIAQYQQHKLHYVLKGLGYLPKPLVEGFISYLKGPTSKQYLHANAHLRLILAVNAKLKTPLQLAQMSGLRKRFAADAIAMQAPKVWQQTNNNKLADKLNPVKLITNASAKNSVAPVNWQDKIIANADDADMKIRCYQAGIGSKYNYNHDKRVMLFLHGGGFCIGDVDTHHEFCHAVCKQTGWSVVSVDYRLAPEHPVPAALRDCIAAYAWLAKHCHSLGALPSRIVLSGDSAGGCLASLVAQQVADPDELSWLELGLSGQKTYHQLQKLPHPLAQMPIYPVTDVETDYPSWALYGNGLLLDHADIAVFDDACLQHSKLYREHPLLSPMLGNNQQVCPTYIVASELDVLRDQAFAYAKQLKSYGVAVETYTVFGAPHGFIHLMSIHQGLEEQTNYIIKQFASFVDEVSQVQTVLVA